MRSPERISGDSEPKPLVATVTWPPITAFLTGPVPWNGTCVRFFLAYLVGQALHQVRRDRQHRVGRGVDGVAVGTGPRDVVGADGAPAARLVGHDDGLTEQALSFGAMIRAEVSAGPPAGNDTTSSISRVG